jgi:predicted PurR-regulated permease PerM
VQFSAISTFLVIIAITVLLHLIAANMLVPRLIGSRVSVGPVAVTVGMLFWGWLWGIFGLLLAVPLTAFVKLMAETQPALVPVASILAESPRKARDERDKVASYLGFAHRLKRKNP